MAFPQGINFRATAGYVTNGANEDTELTSGSTGNPDYPWTTAQGNTVGWESAGSTYQSRDRNSGNDRRLAGINFDGGTGTKDYRIDLPSAGTYNIRLAMGDASNPCTLDCELFDNTTSLGILVNSVSTAANSFADATGTTYTAANWPGSNTAVSKTFSSTICRFRFGKVGVSTTQVAHIYIESATTSGVSFFTQLNLLNGGMQDLAGGFQ